MCKNYKEMPESDPWRRNKFYNPDGVATETAKPNVEHTAPNAEFREVKEKKPRSVGKISVLAIAIELVKSGAATTTETLKIEIAKQRPDANHGTVRKAIAEALRTAATL